MATTVRTLQNFVGGDWVDAGGDEAREIVSPVTGEKLADAPNANDEDVARAARAAREAQPRWAALSAWERAEVCHRIADLIEERKEPFARELSLEQGKPYTAEALPDIEETAENFRLAAEDVKRMETAVIPSQAYSGDAGLDLYAAEAARLEPGQRASVGTGIAVAIPHGHAGLVLPPDQVEAAIRAVDGLAAGASLAELVASLTPERKGS